MNIQIPIEALTNLSAACADVDGVEPDNPLERAAELLRDKSVRVDYPRAAEALIERIERLDPPGDGWAQVTISEIADICAIPYAGAACLWEHLARVDRVLRARRHGDVIKIALKFDHFADLVYARLLDDFSAEDHSVEGMMVNMRDLHAIIGGSPEFPRRVVNNLDEEGYIVVEWIDKQTALIKRVG